MPSNEFDFQEFDPEILASNTSHPTIALVAKRNSGKSWMIKDLVYHMRHRSKFIVFAPTDSVQKFFAEIIPETYIHYKYSAEVLNEIFESQRELIMRDERDGQKGKDRSIIIIMDDCIADIKQWKDDEALKQAFLNGRHYQITLMMTIQYVNAIPPLMRDNFDYIFLFQADGGGVKKKLYDAFNTGFNNYKEFEIALDDLTTDHSTMVICRTKRVNLPIEKVEYYKAKDRRGQKFKVGSFGYRLYHEMSINSNWELDQLNKNKHATTHIAGNRMKAGSRIQINKL